jgi:hypothetical protein
VVTGDKGANRAVVNGIEGAETVCEHGPLAPRL